MPFLSDQIGQDFAPSPWSTISFLLAMLPSLTTDLLLEHGSRCCLTCLLQNKNSENKEKGVQAPWTNNKVIKQNNDNKENNKDYCQKKTFEFGKVRTDNNFNVDKFMQWYNEYCKELSVIRKLTDKRKKAISQLFKNYSEDDIKQVLINVSNSNFLLGKVTDFKAGLDWILNENNFIKILEGRYNSKPKTSKQISSEMGRHNEVMTAAQKKQFKEDVASGRAEKF